MNYANTRSNADRLIVGSGQAMTLNSRSAAAYDTAAGGSAVVSSVDVSCTGVSTNYSDREVDGNMVQRGDAKVVLSAVIATAPKVGDGLLIGTVSYNIVNVTTKSPGGTALVYILQVRRGG